MPTKRTSEVRYDCLGVLEALYHHTSSNGNPVNIPRTISKICFIATSYLTTGSGCASPHNQEPQQKIIIIMVMNWNAVVPAEPKTELMYVFEGKLMAISFSFDVPVWVDEEKCSSREAFAF